MKKILTLLFCLLVTQVAVKASDDKQIDFSQLPAVSQQLIKKHFANQSIALVKM